MKLNYITFMVRDIEKTIVFYQTLAGLKIMRRFNPGMGEIVFMADGETELEFIQFAGVPKVQASGLTMSFKVEGDLSKLWKRAASMGYGPSEIVNQPPKPAHFHVFDPDGIDVEFGL